MIVRIENDASFLVKNVFLFAHLIHVHKEHLVALAIIKNSVLATIHLKEMATPRVMSHVS